ncbi:MAG TPA: DinB family protein [Membranihabitans sp.]|nr:DinB family protein [Membranihabitans sp.]
MKDFFLDIFEYHHHFNQQLASKISNHINEIPAHLFTLYCHTLNAHQIWNARILLHKKNGVFDMHTIDQCIALDHKNYQNTVHIVQTQDFQTVVEYATSDGRTYRNTIQEILFHVSNHSTHHRGQIIAMFRECQIEPLVTDYIFYKRKS